MYLVSLAVSVKVRAEALTNIKEAIELYLEPLEEDLMTTPNSQVMEVAL